MLSLLHTDVFQKHSAGMRKEDLPLPCHHSIAFATAAQDAGVVPPSSLDVSRWLMEVPGLMGGVCFVTGAYLSWAAAHRSWSLLAGDPQQISFWPPTFYLAVRCPSL